MAKFTLPFLLAVACATAKATPGPQTASSATAPVATSTVGNFSQGDLDRAIAARPKLSRQLYELQREALEELILDRLVGEAAHKNGQTPDAYLRNEVGRRVGPPTDKEIQDFYERELPTGQVPLAEVHDRIAAHLLEQSRRAALADLLDSLKAQAKVQILLQAPRIAIAGTGPTRGPAQAPVTVVEFSDFQCPFCSRQEEALRRIQTDYPFQVKLIYRDFPLDAHPDARRAAEAAGCAEDQGHFWEMHDLLFAHQEALAEADLQRYARQLKLDGKRFDQCLASEATAGRIEESLQAGEAAGVDGTPALFVNGRPLTGAVSYDDLRSAIEEELAQRKERP